ncbi:MAG: metal ABC transporter permease, partial [Clostridia bacterium]|nr:metal ABC transporter permease [Clostridia bacterium]
AVAMVSVGALAIGYLLLNVFSVSANVAGDVCGTLFGAVSILTLSEFDVMLCIGLSTVVILLFILFYNRIFAVSFDESFACATGVAAEIYNTVIAVVTSVIIVLAMNLVGSLLVSALIIFPALSAMRIFSSFRAVVICSGIVSVICATTGIVCSILLSVPVGPCIVVVNILCFFVFFIIGRMARR